uniref:Uncharacterized protein n=1 Tax=Cacopsylla melanoneura TaxID=428564 RepID=A0A8D8YLX9_9HEMI
MCFTYRACRERIVKTLYFLLKRRHLCFDHEHPVAKTVYKYGIKVNFFILLININFIFFIFYKFVLLIFCAVCNVQIVHIMGPFVSKQIASVQFAYLTTKILKAHH